MDHKVVFCSCYVDGVNIWHFFPAVCWLWGLFLPWLTGVTAASLLPEAEQSAVRRPEL